MAQGSDSKTPSKPSGSTGGYKDRFWIPRFWDGMGVLAFFRLMSKNGFAVSPIRWAMALIIGGLALFNSALWAIQELFLGRRIRSTEIENHPIFIVGHWRSGTTLLHELLVLDPRHGFPDNYSCFAPNHFLLTGRIIPKMLWFLMPSKRPMDNMKLGWDRPQEDEFAICNMGVPSPYLTWAFPNHPPQYPEYLDLEGIDAESLSHWKERYTWFIQCLTARHSKRIVLKSPPHTSRIKHLLELFPDARFVHIVRDPYVLFPSTMNLWKRLSRDQGFQVPRFEGLEGQVFDTLNRMYAAFESQRDSIPQGRFSEVRYEDLIADPVGQMRRIYGELELGGFDEALPAIEAHVAGTADYKTNRYQISPEISEAIGRRWSAYIEKYGYAREENEVAAENA